MWIHTDTAFVSIVAHRDRPADLLVRARTRRDLEAFGVPESEITVDTDADYLWRATMPRSWVAEQMMTFVERIDYGNVKQAASTRVGDQRARTLMKVWGDLLEIETEDPARCRAHLLAGQPSRHSA